MHRTLFGPSALLLVVLIGCTSTPTQKPETGTDSPEQAAVRQEFNRLKAAIAALKEGKDSADSVWNLLSPESQADAEREAKEVKAAYAKLADKDRPELEKKMALSATELADINGKSYVKSQRFQGKYHKIPDGKVTSITITGDTATLVFTEPDNKTVTAKLARQKAVPAQPLLEKWKFHLDIPKASD